MTQQATVFPGADWEEASPESQGVDAERLQQAVASMESSFGPDGAQELVIIRNGRLIWEGARSRSYHEIYSATKVFTSTVLGLLVDDGRCRPDTFAVEHLPELCERFPAYAKMKLRHLASMTGGYQGRVAGVTEGQQWGDPIIYVTEPEAPLFEPPGSQVDYNDHDVHLLGRALAMRIAQEPLKDLFRHRIAEPIGLSNWDWGVSGTVDGMTHYNAAGTPALKGNGGVRITPRELARFGLLFLSRGRWNGRQLLSESFVSETTGLQVPVDLPGRCSGWLSGAYGFYWYLNGSMASGQLRWPSAPPGTYTSKGAGGNFCFVVPEWNLVVVRMGRGIADGVGGVLREDGLWDEFWARLAEAFDHSSQRSAAVSRKTQVSIRGDAFCVNDQPTYAGRSFQGMKIEGLLMNSRMVQATFDDLNGESRHRWAYPDTGFWDPERNTSEFLAAMPEWRRHGLLAISLNLQGGFPKGDIAEGQSPSSRSNSSGMPWPSSSWWHNSAFTEDGQLRPDYMGRLERILDKADDLGMVAILGLFYFGQDQYLKDESAIVRGLDNAVDWVLDRGYRNVLIEISNECDVSYYQYSILQCDRVHELIERAQARQRNGRRLLVGTSFGGGVIPSEQVVEKSDYVLLHGNNVTDPAQIAEMVRVTRALPTYRPMPILFTEDDHFDFDQPKSNFLSAVSEYASWGFFDFGENNYHDGYQSPPVNWGLNTRSKLEFFEFLKRMVGAEGAARQAGEARSIRASTAR